MLRCIRSVINQTYKNLEIILVDDGSTDSSGKLCDDLSVEDSRITVIHKRNGGLSSARNAGIKIASGNWITFVDSDDWIETDAYAIALQKALEYNVDLVQWNLVLFDEHNEFRSDCCLQEGVKFSSDLVNLSWVFNTAYTKLYSSKWFREYNFIYPDGVSIVEDISVSYKIFSNIKKIYYIDQSFYHYYQRSDSILHIITLDKLEKAYFEMRQIEMYIKTRDSYSYLYSSFLRRKKELKKRFLENLAVPSPSRWRTVFPEINKQLYKENKGSKLYFALRFHLDFLVKLKFKRAKIV